MNKTKAMLSVVIVAGLTVMLGWWFDVQMLKSIIPGLVTMKFLTSLSFVCSGLQLWFITQYEKPMCDTIAAFFSNCVLFLTAGTLVESLSGVNLGFTGLFIQETNAVWSHAPGEPSIATMFGFLLISANTIIALAQQRNAVALRKGMGTLLVFMGSIALIGYSLSVPAMYYYCQDVSTAMAVHTAILFILCGVTMRTASVSFQRT